MSSAAPQKHHHKTAMVVVILLLPLSDHRRFDRSQVLIYFLQIVADILEAGVCLGQYFFEWRNVHVNLSESSGDLFETGSSPVQVVDNHNQTAGERQNENGRNLVSISSVMRMTSSSPVNRKNYWKEKSSH
jgi:hypothetical protein